MRRGPLALLATFVLAMLAVNHKLAVESITPRSLPPLPKLLGEPPSPLRDPPSSPAPPLPIKNDLDTLAVWLGGSGAIVADCPDDCRPQPHCDLYGSIVGPSGVRNIQPSVAACCASCRAHAAAATNGRPCNVWVHCGNATACGANANHCYLKHQDNPLHAPQVGGLGVSWNKLVPWTSGVVAAASATDAPKRRNSPSLRSLMLQTRVGHVRFRLARDASPNATRWLEERAAGATGAATATAAAARGIPVAALPAFKACSGCRFYRAEPVPAGWGHDWFFGPPYALLQGSFGGASSKPFALGKEGGLILRRGSVIMIDKGPDFLIGLATHPEWATSYTHLGDVWEEDLAVVDRIMSQPLLVQNWGAINATVFVEPLGFRLVTV